MSIVITRDYREVDGEQRECYRINDQILTNSSNLLNELHKIGVDITAAQMKFIATKHSIPRRLYEDYGLEYNDLISGEPTMYPSTQPNNQDEPDTRSIEISVDIYKSNGNIDHCEYYYKGTKYLRLNQLCSDLASEDIHLAPMQLRNCIHREISHWVKFKYPNLLIIKHEFDF